MGHHRAWTRSTTCTRSSAADAIFAATGVTWGNLLDGVTYKDGFVHTHTLVMNSSTGTVREVRMKRRGLAAFKRKRAPVRRRKMRHNNILETVRRSNRIGNRAARAMVAPNPFFVRGYP